MEINKDGLNFEQQYKIQQRKKQDDKEMIIKESFNKKYPELCFDDLQKQNSNYMTNDGCIHYKHNESNKIFSWNFIKNEWKENNSMHKLIFDN
jgi:hypothetical protein